VDASEPMNNRTEHKTVRSLLYCYFCKNIMPDLHACFLVVVLKYDDNLSTNAVYCKLSLFNN